MVKEILPRNEDSRRRSLDAGDDEKLYKIDNDDVYREEEVEGR